MCLWHSVFFTGRYMGAVLQFIWGSLSLECILKAKLSWRVVAGNTLAVVCLLREHDPEVLQRLVKLFVFVSLFPTRFQVSFKAGALPLFIFFPVALIE